MTSRLYVTPHPLYRGVARGQSQAAEPLQAPTHDPVQNFRGVSGVSPLKITPAIALPRGPVMGEATLCLLLTAPGA